MSNKAVLALIKKIESLFTQVDSTGGQMVQTFLAFTIPGLPISPKELDFRDQNNEAGNTPQQALNAYANFSRLVNNIPSISTNWFSDGTMLWDEYEKILIQATLASNQATSEENKQLDQAQNFVKEKEAAYQQYQSAYCLAVLRYNNMKITAHNSADWNEVQYKREVDNAHSDWVTKGYKNQVEQAYSTIDQLTGRSPMLFWGQLKDKFQKSNRSDLQISQEFYQTNFYPTNFYRSGAENQWMRLVLDSRDIEQVSSEQTGNDPGLDITVSRLEVELTRVEILRPWMNPSLFKSRFWDWPDNREPLSDGGQRPQGSLPAYATSIVFVRNLKIQTQSASGQLLGNIQSGKVKDLGPLSLQKATVSGSNSIQIEGMQIIAFICQKLPKSPNPDPTLKWSGPIVVKWFSGQYTLDRNAKISQVKVTIRTGGDSGAGTDSYVYFRMNNGQWWELDKPSYNDFEANQTDTYGPFDTNDGNLRVENLSVIPIELRLEKYLWDVAPAWQVAWLRLEVNVEGKGWLTYKEWQPGWLDPSAGTNFKQLQ